MRIALLCHGTVLLPAITTLSSQNFLVGIAVPDIHPVVNQAIHQTADSLNLPFTYLAKEDLDDQLRSWLHDLQPDVVCMMGFPFKIPENVLPLPRFGFFNLHGGKLPQYAGPDPIFWQLKNIEPDSAITVHRVESSMDSGLVAHVEPVPLGSEDTYGMVVQRLGNLLPRALVAFIQQLAIHGNKIALLAQKKCNRSYCNRPTEADQTIDWTLSVRRIDALVRACNPVFGGALTFIKGIPLRILHVTVGKEFTQELLQPGTVVGTDVGKGIEIVCGQRQTLYVDIFCSEGGIFTGFQFSKLFQIKPHDLFYK
jgi:methionyl-tRNA formyltransferase